MSVVKVYQDIIDDVISGVRELFLEDGVDEQVLQELKQSWETKLIASKAVDNKSEIEKQALRKAGEVSNGTAAQKAQQLQQQAKQVVGQVPPNNHVQTQAAALAAETKMVPIQITLPAQPGTTDGPKVLTIQVPASALTGNQLHKVLTGPVITATMNLPHAIASSLLQQHVNAAFHQPTQGTNILGTVLNTKSVIQNDGAHDSEDEGNEACSTTSQAGPSCSTNKSGTKPRLPGFVNKKRSLLKQTDGRDDTSDDDDDDGSDEDISDDHDDEKEDEAHEMDEGEPLNSDDDVTDENPTDLFDTENVVVCQYDKITRSRNKWKFHLKDGIMNLNGQDYLFQKANGDAEW